MKLENIIAKSKTSTVYVEDGVVIKAFAWDTPKSSLFDEAYAIARIEETSLNIPEILGVCQLPDRRWAILTKLIEGQTLKQLIHKDAPEQYDEYIELLVKTQLTINDVVIHDIVPWKSRIERNIQNLSGKHGISSSKIYELLTRLDGMPRHAKLCHGNLSLDNLILDDNGEPFIIDWGNAARGNGSAETANTYLNINIFSTTMAENYLKIYCDYAGVGKRYVTEWIPIMAAEQLSRGPLSRLHKDLLLAWMDV